MPFFIFVGALGVIIGGIGTYNFQKQYADNKADVRRREEEYEKKVRKYNAVIDEMLAVPKYEGHVDYSVKVKIPSKI